MNHLKTYEGLFSFLYKKSNIEKFILDEVKKTEQFGLKIKKEDIRKEVKVIESIFLEFFDDIKNSTSQSYQILKNTITKAIMGSLENEIKYYYDYSIKNSLQVKNMYNCHLDSIISNLFILIGNDLIKESKDISNDDGYNILTKFIDTFADDYHLRLGDTSHIRDEFRPTDTLDIVNGVYYVREYNLERYKEDCECINIILYLPLINEIQHRQFGSTENGRHVLYMIMKYKEFFTKNSADDIIRRLRIISNYSELFNYQMIIMSSIVRYGNSNAFMLNMSFERYTDKSKLHHDTGGILNKYEWDFADRHFFNKKVNEELVTYKQYKDMSANFNMNFYSKFEEFFKKFKDHDRNFNRIYFPLQVDSSRYQIKAPKELSDWMRWNNYHIVDYDKGLCYNKQGKIVRIGKLLNSLGETELLKVYNKSKNTTLKNVDNLSVVISRHPYDIVGMSTNRGWTTCHDLNDKRYGGEHLYGLKSNLKSGCLIGYLIRRDDRNINNPLARCIISGYYDLNASRDIYGTYIPEFEEFMKKFAKKCDAYNKSN